MRSKHPSIQEIAHVVLSSTHNEEQRWLGSQFINFIQDSSIVRANRIMHNATDG